MAERRAILSGSTFEDEIGYARAVVDGDWVHVSGTTGFDYARVYSCLSRPSLYSTIPFYRICQEACGETRCEMVVRSAIAPSRVMTQR